MSIPKLGGITILALALPWCTKAQAPAAPAKPDSAQVKAMLEKTKKTAGTMWAEEEHFFCEDHHGIAPSDPPITPAKIFDNVYTIGNAGTVVYVIQTSDGLLMIDSLLPNQVDSQLLPGFKKLGLDPANVKIVLVGHGHLDHFGGTPYMQEHYGSKIYISVADWNLIENPPPGRGGGKKGPPPVLPNHDQVIVEGQPVVLGDLKVMPFAIPGHTPGSMGFIFPVKDNGKTHMAAIYAGTILVPAGIPDEGLQTYLKSIAHFKEETKKAKVDVEIQNHPFMDPIQAKVDKLASRKDGEPNPFVIGEANYQKFLDVMSECIEVEVARRR
ncbi:MAG: MBL fold metallo-hydrolase [Acidobacteriota bacterium]|nr:MBL fold metallo-hydrolase [Acidobacteriota bacterium]